MRKNNFLNIISPKVEQDYHSSLMKGNKVVTFLNPFSYLVLRKSKIRFDKIDSIFIDGIALVLFMRLKGIKCKRNSFDMTSLAPKVFRYCSDSEKKIYFMGAKEDEISNAVQKIKNKFTSLDIVGFRNGYFEGKDSGSVCESIIMTKPDVVILGMGTPMQENISILLKNKGFEGTIFTCGGFFHQTAKGIKYYPDFFNRFNIRWIYRIYDEPKLFKRYFFQYPKFIFIFLNDLLTNRKHD